MRFASVLPALGIAACSSPVAVAPDPALDVSVLSSIIQFTVVSAEARGIDWHPEPTARSDFA